MLSSFFLQHQAEIYIKEQVYLFRGEGGSGGGGEEGIMVHGGAFDNSEGKGGLLGAGRGGGEVNSGSSEI